MQGDTSGELRQLLADTGVLQLARGGRHSPEAERLVEALAVAAAAPA